MEINFRRCEAHDLTSNNYTQTESMINERDFTRWFCPDITDDLKQFYQLKNLYEHIENKISFSIEILACNQT